MKSREDKFWAKIRPHFPHPPWRMEDKLAVGRPDVLYRLEGIPNDVGIFEMKALIQLDLDKPIKTNLTVEQAMILRQWSHHNFGVAHLLIQMNDTWLLIKPESQVVKHARDLYTPRELIAAATWTGVMTNGGCERLVQCLYEAHKVKRVNAGYR